MWITLLCSPLNDSREKVSRAGCRHMVVWGDTLCHDLWVLAFLRSKHCSLVQKDHCRRIHHPQVRVTIRQRAPSKDTNHRPRSQSQDFLDKKARMVQTTNLIGFYPSIWYKNRSKQYPHRLRYYYLGYFQLTVTKLLTNEEFRF